MIIQVDWSSTEFCYTPIIQSQSTSTGYDLSPAAESSSDNIAHKGVFLVAVGMRYKGYCANLGRSFIVDPSKVSQCAYFCYTHPTLDSQEQEAIYLLLVSLQTEILTQLKGGAMAKEVYHHALSYVKQRKPELEKHFVKNVGHGVSRILRLPCIYTQYMCFTDGHGVS